MIEDDVEYNEYDTSLYNGHHYYGHVGDAAGANLVRYMVGVPLLFVLIALMLAMPGIMVTLVLIWAFWK